MTTIGLIGSGNIGTAIAKQAIANGHEVVLSNSRGPETLSDLVSELGPQARAATAQESAEAGDLVVVTVPFKAYTEVPVEPLAGKVVIVTEVANTGSAAVAVSLTTAYGTQDAGTIASGKKISRTTTTHLTSIPAGQVTVTATAQGTGTAVTADYAARTCAG